MFNKMKRLSALLLALVMVFSLLPANLLAFAEELPVPQEIDQAAYAEVDSVFDLIDESEAEPARKNATDEEKVEEAIAIVMASDSYVEGSLERNGNFFTWETDDGIRCAYSPRMREIDEKRTPETSEDAIVNEPVAVKGGSPTGNQVYLIGPYYGSDDSFTDQYKKEAKRVAEAIGDADGYTLYSGKSATVDKVAEAISNGAVVFFDSHGMTDYENPNNELDCSTKATVSYLCLTSTTGLTDEDYDDGALYYSDGICINGATIANHMTKNSPAGILWMAICLGMATDTMCNPLREKGVEVVYGYSESVTFEGDYRFEKAFWDAFVEGVTVAEAIAAMKAKWGDYDWSTQIANDYGSYDGYTSLREAQDDFTAFPVVVSDEDPHPGKRTTSSYGASTLQTVKSTYVLFTPCDHVWTEATCSAAATCTLCGRTNGKPLPHTDADGNELCDVCNADMSVSPNTYVKVTEEPDDWSGQYLIVYEAGGLAFNGSLNVLEATNNGFPVTIVDDVIVLDEADANNYFVIEPLEMWYSIKSASGYFIGNTSGRNKLEYSKTTDYAHDVYMEADGSVLLETEDYSILRFNKNEDQNRFRFYKESSYASQEPVALYKLADGSTSSGGSGSSCSHSWTDATCTSPKTCALCGATEGSALGHTWASATCTSPKTCYVCGATSGSTAAHTDSNSDNACDVCGTSMGTVTPPVVSGTDYVLITSAEQFTTGKYVMIADKGYGPGVYSSGWLTAVKPTVSGNVVTDTKDAVWSLTVNGSSVALTDANGANIKPKGGNNNGISTGSYNWAWEFDASTGTFVFKGVSSDTVTLASNTGSGNQFRAYKNTTVAGGQYPYHFKLYKLVEEVHEHDYIRVVTTAPTCTTPGVATYTCSCGDHYTETVTAQGHKYSPVVTAPTCVDAGYTTYTCAACGDFFISDRVNATGVHSYDNDADADCNVCGFGRVLTASDLTFLQAPSLSFQDYIGMQVLVTSSLTKSYSEIYVEAVQIDPEKGAVTTRLEGFLYYYDMYLVFDQQILSWSMTEKVTLTLYGVKDGKTYAGQNYTASVEELAMQMLASYKESNAKVCRVLVDMLNYGAAVQTTFNHNAVSLPNTRLGEYAQMGTTDTPEMSAVNTEAGAGAVQILQTSVSMQSKVEIQLLFAQNISAYEAKAAIGETALNAVVDTETMGAYGFTIVRVAIGAANMRDTVTFALYDADGNPVTVVKSVSVEALVKDQVNGAQSAVIVAMMRYGDAVTAFAGK